MKYIKSLIKTIILAIGCVSYRPKQTYMVYYHDVHSDSRQPYTAMSTDIRDLQNHIAIIKALGFDIVRQFSGRNREIRIAFDDGFKGIYDNRTFFIDNNIPVTIFVPTSLIDQDNYLTRKELLELENLGFNIQSHGIRHADMSKMSEETLRDDLSTSKKLLESLLNKEVSEICFPMGYFSDKVISIARESGYKSFFSSMPNPNGFPKELKGRLFFQNLNKLQVYLSLKGGMQLLQNHYKKIHYKN